MGETEGEGWIIRLGEEWAGEVVGGVVPIKCQCVAGVDWERQTQSRATPSQGERDVWVDVFEEP